MGMTFFDMLNFERPSFKLLQSGFNFNIVSRFYIINSTVQLFLDDLCHGIFSEVQLYS